MIEGNKEKERSKEAIRAFRKKKLFFFIVFIISFIGIVGGIFLTFDPHKMEIVGTNSPGFSRTTKISQSESRVHGIVVTVFSALLAYTSIYFCLRLNKAIKAEEEFLNKINQNI